MDWPHHIQTIILTIITATFQTPNFWTLPIPQFRLNSWTCNNLNWSMKRKITSADKKSHSLRNQWFSTKAKNSISPSKGLTLTTSLIDSGSSFTSITKSCAKFKQKFSTSTKGTTSKLYWRKVFLQSTPRHKVDKKYKYNSRMQQIWAVSLLLKFLLVQ